MKSVQKDIDERTNLTSSNKFELLLFRLGTDGALGQSELFGINVFKIREIVAMPAITPIVGATAHSLGVVNLRGQVIPVLDLPSIVGCKPTTGLNIMLVTEYARTTQAFAVESVEDIVRLDWNQVISAESSGAGHNLVTSIARLDGNTDGTRLAQVLDVEAILQMVSPDEEKHQVDPQKVGPKLKLKPGTIILAADDSFVARSLIEQELKVLQAPYEMVKSGKEAWERLNALARTAELGDCVTVSLDADALGDAVAEYQPDLVLDFLWGPVAEVALTALGTRGLANVAHPVTYVEIGAAAGATASVPAAVLRSRSVTLRGSGAGSVAHDVLATAAASYADLIGSGIVQVDAVGYPLDDISTAWADTSTDHSKPTQASRADAKKLCARC